MRKVLLITLSLICSVSAHAAINAQFSFEERVPSFVRANGRGVVNLASEKYKDGKTSLKFEWNGPVQLMFTNSADMEASMKVDGGGMILWVYNTTPFSEPLLFKFHDWNGGVICQFNFNMNFTGDCFVIFSTIAYAVSSVLMKRYSKYEDPVVISGYQFFMGGIVMIIAGLSLGGVMFVPDITAFLVLTYLAILSAVAYALWGVLLKHNPVSKVTIYSFSIPVFGVLLSNIMLTEQSNVEPINLIITLILICTGIILLNYNKKQ